MDPQLTVVIPVGSVGPDLHAQVLAVVGQRCAFDFDVVLSMNSPDPDAAHMLDQFLLSITYSALRVVRSDDLRSAAHARNVGARASTAPIVAFCDADDLVHDGWLQALREALDDAEAEGAYDAVGGQLAESTEERLAAGRPPATPGGLPTFLAAPYIVSANMAIRRAAFELVGGFDETLTRCEDIAISWKLIEAGRRIGFAPGAIATYRSRSGLRATIHQHYLYGVGMSEVILRYGVPAGGAQPRSKFALLRPNGQRGATISLASFARRAAIGVGRFVGICREGLRRRRTAKAGIDVEEKGAR